MSAKQELIVYGFVRRNYITDMNLVDIIKIIYQFYFIAINSNLLTDEEKMALINLLFERLTHYEQYRNMTKMDTKLEFRASEHNYKREEFWKVMKNTGSSRATLAIVHNEKNHIFGMFMSKSWKDLKPYKWETDPTAFLFVIRPTIQAFQLRDESGEESVGLYGYSYGPVFGKGPDIWIVDRCNEIDHSGCRSDTFVYDVTTLSGVETAITSGRMTNFVVNDFEVFTVDITCN